MHSICPHILSKRAPRAVSMSSQSVSPQHSHRPFFHCQSPRHACHSVLSEMESQIAQQALPSLTNSSGKCVVIAVIEMKVPGLSLSQVKLHELTTSQNVLSLLSTSQWHWMKSVATARTVSVLVLPGVSSIRDTDGRGTLHRSRSTITCCGQFLRWAIFGRCSIFARRRCGESSLAGGLSDSPSEAEAIPQFPAVCCEVRAAWTRTQQPPLPPP